MSCDEPCCPKCGSSNIVGMACPNLIECDDCEYKGFANDRTYRHSRRGFDY